MQNPVVSPKNNNGSSEAAGSKLINPKRFPCLRELDVFKHATIGLSREKILQTEGRSQVELE